MARRAGYTRIERNVIREFGSYQGNAIKLLQAEHARAVRIVKQVVKHAAHMEQQTRVNREANAYWQGKLDGAENILTSLQKGRAQ